MAFKNSFAIIHRVPLNIYSFTKHIQTHRNACTHGHNAPDNQNTSFLINWQFSWLENGGGCMYQLCITYAILLDNIAYMEEGTKLIQKNQRYKEQREPSHD